MTEGRLKGRRVAIGVCGGIAAYKAIECIRLLTEAGAEVRVLMTPEATRFVAPLSLEALSYNPVAADWLSPQGGGESHIRLAEWADVIAIVPATANTMAKLALGFADEIVSGTVLASRAPLVIAPAMNDVMLTQQPTQDHLNALRARRAVIVEPATGRLASGKSGEGRLAAPDRSGARIDSRPPRPRAAVSPRGSPERAASRRPNGSSPSSTPCSPAAGPSTVFAWSSAPAAPGKPSIPCATSGTFPAERWAAPLPRWRRPGAPTCPWSRPCHPIPRGWRRSRSAARPRCCRRLRRPPPM